MPPKTDWTSGIEIVSQTNRKPEPPPRVWLFFISIFLNLCGSALAGLTHFLGIPWLVLTATAIWGIWFAVIFAIAIPATDQRLARVIHWLKPLSKTLLVIIALFAIVEIIGLGIIYIGSSRGMESSLAQSVEHAFQPADAMALTQQAAQNLLDGKNPYTSSNIITALGDSPAAFDKITPLYKGSLADSFPYPTTDQLRSLWDEAINSPQQVPPEIETHQSYPAGSFLLAAPFMALGIKDIRIAFLLLALPALAYAAWRIKPGLRIYFILGVVLSVEVWNAVGGGDTSLLYFPFLLLSWILIRRNLWLSAICMGVAIATKQVAWFFLPFYLILIMRTVGAKKAVATLAIAAGVFAAFNLSFIILDPGVWLASVAAPIRDSMFPEGVGIITVVSSGLVHITSPTIFSLLEGTALVAALVWYYRNSRRYPHTALVLALSPLFFAWRSMWNYFYYADIVLLAVILMETQDARVLYSNQPAPTESVSSGTSVSIARKL